MRRRGRAASGNTGGLLRARRDNHRKPNNHEGRPGPAAGFGAPRDTSRPQPDVKLNVAHERDASSGTLTQRSRQPASHARTGCGSRPRRPPTITRSITTERRPSLAAARNRGLVDRSPPISSTQKAQAGNSGDRPIPAGGSGKSQGAVDPLADRHSPGRPLSGRSQVCARMLELTTEGASVAVVHARVDRRGRSRLGGDGAPRA